MDSLDSEAGKYEAIGQIDYYVNDNEDDAIEGIFSRVFVRYSQYQQTLNYKRRKQNKTDSEDEEDIEEEEEDDEYLEEVLEETENEDSVIREEFDIQWAENGQDIILKLWIEKYKDFVDPNFIDNSLDNNTEESVENSTIDRLNESVNSVDHTEKIVTEDTQESSENNIIDSLNESVNSVDHTEKIVTEDVYDHVNDIDNVSIDDEVNKINGNFAKQISLETNEPNILLNEIEYQNTNSSVNLETDIKNQDCTVQDNTKEISGDYGTEWDQLWQNHCIEVYNSHFDTFKQDWIRNLAETLTQANNSTGLEYFELVKQEALTTLQKRGQGRRNQTGETSNQHQTNDLKLSDETQTQDKKPKGYKRDFQKSSLVDFIENNLVELVNKYDDQPPTLVDNCDAQPPTLVDNCDAQQPTLVDNCDAQQPTLVDNCDAEHPNVGDKVRGAHPNPFQCDNVDSSVNKNCELIEQNKNIEIQNERTEEENNPKDLEPDSTKNNITANSFDRKGIEKNTKEVQEYIDSQDTEEKTKESEESQTGEEPNAEDDELNATPLTSYSKFINEPNYLLNKLGLHFGSATESTDSSLLSTEDRKVPSPFYKRQELSLFVSKSKFKTMNFRLKIDTKDEAMEEKCDAYGGEDFERNREYGEKYEEKDSERITGYDFKYNEFGGKINLPKNESDGTSFSCSQSLNKTEPDGKTRLPVNRHTYFKYSDDEECSGSLDSSKTNGGSGVKDVIKERHSNSANMYRTIEQNIDTAGKDNIVKNKKLDEFGNSDLDKTSTTDKTGILMECHEDILSNKMSLAENKDERVDKNAEEDLSDDIKEGPEELEIIKDLNGTETVHIDWTNFDESMQTYNETHDSLQTKRKRNKKKKKKKQTWEEETTGELSYFEDDLGHNVPVEILANPYLNKYYLQRYLYWSRYDEGILMDEESWYSVTPEKVAEHIASRVKETDVVVDAFCGCGGNTIQFAIKCRQVISIDIDPAKLRLAQHNATVYGVAHKIQFILGDFYTLAPSLQGDVVLLSPPWGGPAYSRSSFSLEYIFPEHGGGRGLFDLASRISPNIGYYLPRTSDVSELIPLAGQGGSCEIEQNFVGRKFVAITAYYGRLVRRKTARRKRKTNQVRLDLVLAPDLLD